MHQRYNQEVNGIWIIVTWVEARPSLVLAFDD